MILQDWDEIEALQESLREHMAEIKRLNDCLTWEQHRAEHVGTHGPGCAEWGPRHYECLLRAHEALKTQTALREPLTDERIRLIDSGTHFHESSDWSLRFARAIERAHGIGSEE